MCSVGVRGRKQTELPETLPEPEQKELRRGDGMDVSSMKGAEAADLGWPGCGMWGRERQQRPRFWLRAGLNGPRAPRNRGLGGGKEMMSSLGGLLNWRAT